MTQQRALSANERIYLAGKRTFSDIVIQLFIKGEGSISADSLKSAIAASSAHLPGTRLRLEKSQWIADAEPPPLIELESVPELKHDFAETVQRRRPFDPGKGYTCDIALANQNGQCFVAFRALHAVMDGRGLEFWAKAVFAALRGAPPVVADSLLVDDEFVKQQRAGIRRDEPAMPTKTGPAFKGSSHKQFTFDYATCTLHGVHAGIVAKLSTGIQRLLLKTPRDTGCVMVPVDLRQAMSDKDAFSTCNLSLPVFVPIQQNQSWQTFSKTLLSKLDEQRFIARGRSDILYRLLPNSWLGRLLGTLWKAQTKKGKYMVSGVVSHTGRQHLDDYSCAEFKANKLLFVPCVIPIAPFSVIITETDKTTELCLVTSRCLWDKPHALLENLIQAADLNAHLVQETRSVSLLSPETPLPPFNQVDFADADAGLHELFERQVKRTPDAICLQLEQSKISYKELNAEANQLAQLILARGIKKGDVIGVGMERSFEMITAILAILKVGGAYLPLDPSLPTTRLNYMIADSAPAMVICRSSHKKHFIDANVSLCLDDEAKNMAAMARENPAIYKSATDKQSPCYLIYTSGSTGNPKATINTHEAAVNHFLFLQERYQFSVDDVTFQKTPISFDASLLEIFLPLFAGAKLVLAKPEGHKDIHYLSTLIKTEGITFISIIPSVLNNLLDELESTSDSNVRLLLVGGELFSKALHEKVKRQFNKASICNLYGPAEAAIDSLLYDEEAFSSYSVPIGKAIANMEAFVVNEQLQRVMPGEKGELILAGRGIGLGYLNREALTSEKFIAHPFRADVNFRAYRTGDVVKQLPDGNIEFLGRFDHQVKVNGVRIELGEIEHQIQALPEINDAAVITIMQGESQVLVAYCTLYAEHVENEARILVSLRQKLREKLPDYMLPAKFIVLEKMPLSVNGKLDRAALDNLSISKKCNVGEDRALTEQEEKLAAIWKTLLNTDIALDDDFFELGGNSMLAIKLINEVNARFGTRLHAAMLYDDASFANMAKEIS